MLLMWTKYRGKKVSAINKPAQKKKTLPQAYNSKKKAITEQSS